MVQGQQVEDWQEGVDRVHDRAVSSGSPSLPKIGPHEGLTGDLSHSYLKPGGSLVLFSWPRNDKNGALWEQGQRDQRLVPADRVLLLDLRAVLGDAVRQRGLAGAGEEL